MVTPAPSIVVQRLLYIYDVLQDERRLSVVGEVESAVEVGLLVHAGRPRQSVLMLAFKNEKPEIT